MLTVLKSPLTDSGLSPYSKLNPYFAQPRELVRSASKLGLIELANQPNTFSM